MTPIGNPYYNRPVNHPRPNRYRYDEYLQQNPEMPEGIMAQTFSIPQYGGLQSRLDKMYEEGGGGSLYEFAMEQYDPSVQKTALDYRDYLENLNKQQQSLRSSTMMAGDRIPQPFTNQPKPTAPTAPNYGIGQQRYGSQQSAAARGFYQTPFAYQNL